MPQAPAEQGNPGKTMRGPEDLRQNLRVRNRRKRYLDLHKEYFLSPNIELADPLLYDQLIRRFQSVAEREAEGRKKGYSGVLEADILRSEAKLAALAHSDPSSTTYQRGADGEILPEKKGEIPATKDEGKEAWHEHIRWRFLRGHDDEFDYSTVDESEIYDHLEEERRDEEEQYFGQEEPSWLVENGSVLEGGQPVDLKGETGVQDF